MTVKTENVRQNDCPWRLAERNLKSKSNQKVTNAQIVAEMNRLAKLNNCENVNDFAHKFFNSVDNAVVVENTNETPKTAVENKKPVTTKKPATQKQVAPKAAVKKQEKCCPPKVSVKEQSAQKTQSKIVVKTQPKYSAKEQEVQKINSMKSDTQRIVEYNKKNYNGNYYGIVDKKSCQLKIYDKSGKVIKTFEVGIGKKKGDNLSMYYQERAKHTSKAYMAENGRYTTPGEFTLDEVAKNTYKPNYKGKDGSVKIMYLKGDNRGEKSGQTAVHIVPNNHAGRIAKFDNGNLSDNRMSYGCVNLREKDYDEMHKYLSEGDKLFILPEEQGNKLLLEKQKDGSYKFEQQYHKDQKRGMSKEQASVVKYDVRPDRDPKVLLEKEKAKKAAEEKQKMVAENKNEGFSLFRPSTWFS